MDFNDYFKNKKITLMGLGLLGRGVGDAAFLAEHGANVTVTDLKTDNELRESVEKLRGYSNIRFVLGEHKEDDFITTDMVIKAAGVPLSNLYIDAARAAGVPVKMSTSLFAELSPATILGVTGTRGKSTVTHLVYEILKADGRHVFLGGNVRGVSTLAHLPESTEDEIAVLELDSWQLQGFHGAQLSPHIGVFTTFMADHMNYYPSMERYFYDKSAIFAYQREDDVCVVGRQVEEQLNKYGGACPGQKVVADARSVPSDWVVRMPGEHNRYNAGCALEVVRTLGVDDEKSKKALETFAGVPGRLELIAEKKSVAIYNDNNATTPDAVIAAIEAFSGKRIVLMCGGTDKGVEMGRLPHVVRDHNVMLVLLSGSGTEKLKQELIGVGYSEYETLEECVMRGWECVEEGDVLLFSPGFSSFEKFNNEYDRGEQFVKIVQTL